MDWGNLCDRLSRDYRWTLREILELTPREVLLYVAVRRPASRVLMSTRAARAIATAARERRRAWIERELRGDRSDEPEACGDWERLVCWSERRGGESSKESVVMSGDERWSDPSMIGDGERLRQICDELRMIRAAVSSERRAWRE